MSNSHEKPMLFSTDMVEATIKGTKTNTRRTRGLEEINKNPNDWANIDIQWGADKAFITAINRKSGDILDIKCPYGTIHSKLRVHEVDGSSPSLSGKDLGWGLKIESIGIDRLKNISKEDAIAEGIKVLENDVQYSYKDYLSDEVFYFDPRNSFESLWDSINGEGAWDFNPWVWVIKFSKLKK